ncbi:GNAT family N-acetyltransferase [bacterium]|jgi:N-acetylglutamate synthase-like GNAT family acetyltransferase|nr:GNAT family N-acetyltransferase [bacterium]MBT6832163.1 GNAT family N-acetyltransferase [bacterium]MBT6996391.1 GNAT family N-acetyltransferase [bacterium]MBT7772126.1 GNAT family N-acetyltransferase [bacterium]
MKFVPLKNKKKSQTLRLLKLIFPAVGAAVLWQFFQKERRSQIKIIDGLRERDFFWQSFLMKLQKKKDTTIFMEIWYEEIFHGVVAYSFLYLFRKKIFFLKFFAIEPRLQGNGVGTQVLQKIEQLAETENCHSLWLLASPFKRRVQHFYFSRGFKRVFWGIFYKKISQRKKFWHQLKNRFLLNRKN